MNSVNLSPLQLMLDTSNPRFLNGQIDEMGAISYLLKYSKVANLAESIIVNGGLYMGERIVVLKNEDNTYTVLEGNRRTCACKLLISRELIPEGYRNSFPIATQNVLDNISTVEVDVVNNRDEAASYIADRHVDSVMLWSPLAKMKFFVDRFDSGQNIQSISTATHAQVSKVKRGIKEYKLINYALNLPQWTSQQRDEKLNLFNLEIDKFLRIFRTEGALRAFGLDYDESFNPFSSLGSDVLDQILGQIMYCAYIEERRDQQISTRTANWRDVPGLVAILENAGVNEETPAGNPNRQRGRITPISPQTNSQEQSISGDENTQVNPRMPVPSPTGPIDSTPIQANPVTTTQNDSPRNIPPAEPRPASPTYYRDFVIPTSCRLNIALPKIHNIYSELQRINLRFFPNAAAITFRVFFDLTIDEYVSSRNLTLPSRPTLSDKFNAVLRHLEQNGLLPHRDANALRQLTSNNPQNPTILSISNFHDYVHRLNYQPNARDLTIIWDNLQQLMEIIYQ